MKIAVVGKGGAGKTTTAAVLARALARRGLDVVALDGDPNPNLGLSLGMGEEPTLKVQAMRQALDEGREEHAPGWPELLARFGVDGPDGVRLAVVTEIADPQLGCPCCGLSPEQLLSSLDSAGSVVIADLEAGTGTLTRLGDSAIDAVVVLVEPFPRSLEVGRRAAEIVAERGMGQVIVVANRLRDERDLEVVREAFPGRTVLGVPDDVAVQRSERAGESLLEGDAEDPALHALLELADLVVPVA